MDKDWSQLYDEVYENLAGSPAIASDCSAADTTPPKQPSVRRSSYLTVSQNYDLNVVCRPLAVLFGHGVYQVGSSLERPNYRDVDLRCILANDEYDRMFADDEQGKKVKFLNVAISEWIATRTGLPIDFQFQREAEANAEFKGTRNTVGCTAP